MVGNANVIAGSTNVYPSRDRYEATAARSLPEAATITSRAQRVLSLVRMVEDRAGQVLSVVSPKSEGEPDQPRPDASHAVFALEEAEQRLDTTLRRLDEAIRLL